MKENKRVNAGAWRKGEAPMQVISGTTGREIVHFEAPPSYLVPREMDKFVQ